MDHDGCITWRANMNMANDVSSFKGLRSSIVGDRRICENTSIKVCDL